MLYYLHFLKDYFSPLNVFQYITFRTGGAIITSLLLTILVGIPFIKLLKSKGFGQKIREEVPKTHLRKSNTPTMGGLLILFVICLTTTLWARLDNRFILILIFSIIYLGFLGFVDDYLKVIKKLPTGLPARKKLFWQLILSFLIIGYLFLEPPNRNYKTIINIPYLKESFIDLGSLYIIFAMILIVSASNGVNLTDGLDGLAIGCLVFSALTFGVFSYLIGNAIFSKYLKIIYVPGAGEITIFLASIVGAGLGFLWFNSYPANIFMGDTGSLFLGGSLGIIAIMIKQELILLIIGGVFVIEAASVILQIFTYRYMNKKRIFKMSPLHHHFELKGLQEPKITVRFWIMAIIFSLIALSSLKIR